MIPGTNSTAQLDSECFILHDTRHKQHHTAGQWVLYTTSYQAQTAPHSWTVSALNHMIPGTNSTTQLDSECFLPHDTRHKQHRTVGQWVLYTTWYQAQTAPHSWTVNALYHMIPGTNSTTQLDSECFIPHDTRHKQHHTVGQWVLYTTWYQAQTAPHSWTVSALYHMIPGTNSTTQLDSECFIPHDTRHKQHHTVGQWVLYTTWYQAQTAPHSWTVSVLYHMIPGTNSTTQLDSGCFIPHDTRHKQHHTAGQWVLYTT